jgi:hypothetical protein
VNRCFKGTIGDKDACLVGILRGVLLAFIASLEANNKLSVEAFRTGMVSGIDEESSRGDEE